MPEWKGIVGRGFTAVEFQQYVGGIRLNHWKPQFTVVHNTQKPTLAEWRMKPGEMHMQDLQSYYRDTMHWSAGPHLFIADDLIWVFTSLDTSGIHSPSWNAVSWGVELVGDYDLEPLSAGTRENAAIALVSLHALGGLDPRSLKIHKEDPKTTHTYCPGRNIVKADLIQWTVAGLAQYRLGDGSAAERLV